MGMGSLAFLVALLISGFFFNMLGIYCCMKQKLRMKKQKIILLNLSCVQTTIILYTLLHLCLAHGVIPHRHLDLDLLNKIMCTAYHILTSLFYDSMLLISIDRLLCVLSPLYYRIEVVKSTLTKTVLVIWFKSLLWPVPFAFFDLELNTKVVLYYSYAMQILFLLISVFAYTLIARSQERRRFLFEQTTGRSNHGNSTATPTAGRLDGLHKRTFVVSFCLILNFIVFYIVPNYIHSEDIAVSTLLTAFTYIGLILDPIMYTILNPALRNIARNFCTCNGRIFCCRGRGSRNQEGGRMVGAIEGAVARRVTLETPNMSPGPNVGTFRRDKVRKSTAMSGLWIDECINWDTINCDTIKHNNIALTKF